MADFGALVLPSYYAPQAGGRLPKRPWEPWAATTQVQRSRQAGALWGPSVLLRGQPGSGALGTTCSAS